MNSPYFSHMDHKMLPYLVNILTRCFCYATRNLTRLRVVYLATRSHGRIVAVLANHKRGMETLCGPSPDWSCDGPATPAGLAHAAGCSRAGSAMHDGAALSAVPGRQGCSPRVISGSPAESAVCPKSAVSGGLAVSTGSASCTRSATSAGPSACDVTSAGVIDSVDFSDMCTICISPLLDDLDQCVVEPVRVSVDGDTGWSVEPLLCHSRACCDDPGWPDRSAQLVFLRLDREEAAGWAIEPQSLSSARDHRDDPCCPVESWWRESVGVAALDVEFLSRPLWLERPEDDDACLWSLLWWWGDRRRSDECLEGPRSLE